jgi:hypothetical protein
MYHRTIQVTGDISLLVMTNSSLEGLCSDMMLQFPYAEREGSMQYGVVRTQIESSEEKVRLTMQATTAQVRSIDDFTPFQHMGLAWLYSVGERSLALACVRAVGKADHILRKYLDAYVGEYIGEHRFHGKPIVKIERSRSAARTMFVGSRIASCRFWNGDCHE